MIEKKIVDILDKEYKEYISYFNNDIKKFMNGVEDKLKCRFLNTAKMLIDNKDKLDINIIDALFIYRLGYVADELCNFIIKDISLSVRTRRMVSKHVYDLYKECYNRHNGILKEEYISHKEILAKICITSKLENLNKNIYTDISILANMELDYNNIFYNILKSTGYNTSIDVNQEDEYDLTYSYQLENKVTEKINRLELFHKLHIVESWSKDFVVVFFKIVDSYGKNSNFFKMLEGSSVVDKTKVDRLKKDIDIAINRAIVYNHIVIDVTEYREEVNNDSRD